MADKKNYYYGLGRRKGATARVRVMPGKGNYTINGKTLEEYVDNSKYLINLINRPFTVLEQNGKYDVTVIVSGGGSAGQVVAIQLGIAKALVAFDENLKSTLKRADLLGRDPREKERKKFGLKGARKQRQFTKR